MNELVENTLSPFHLAIPVHDLEAAKEFYGSVLESEEGRSSDSWVDYNFFGHQLVCHKSPGKNVQNDISHVDGHGVPVPHFGIVLEIAEWKKLRDKLIAKKIQFVLEPMIRFEGEVGEQATMFFLDPSGNALEFKAFKNIAEELFRNK